MSKSYTFPAVLMIVLLSSCVSVSITNPDGPVSIAEEAGQSTLNTDNLTTVDELLIEDTQIGDGAEAQSGALVTVHYTGRLTNGEVFDSSVDGEPFTFPLGQGSVIQGWEEGLIGMKVGGKRTLTIPSDLAYGDQGSGSIPPGATLVFDVELLEVRAE